MAKKPDWEIPLLAQPKPEEFDFDLDRALQSVVGLHANIPEDAYTASILGTGGCWSVSRPMPWRPGRPRRS